MIMVTIKTLRKNSPWLFSKFVGGKRIKYSLRTSKKGHKFLLVTDSLRFRKQNLLYHLKYSLVFIKEDKLPKLARKGTISNNMKEINEYLKNN